MSENAEVDQLMGSLHRTTIRLVADERPDLTARQFAVFLTCYVDQGPHTVRGLAAGLAVAKSVISRALDQLETWDLARRKPDPTDRRSLTVERTVKGTMFLRVLRNLMEEPAEIERSPRLSSRRST